MPKVEAESVIQQVQGMKVGDTKAIYLPKFTHPNPGGIYAQAFDSGIPTRKELINHINDSIKLLSQGGYRVISLLNSEVEETESIGLPNSERFMSIIMLVERLS